MLTYVIYYLLPWRVRSIAISLSTCMYVCLSVRSHTKTTCPNFTKFYVHVGVARSSSDDNAIRYVLSDLWIYIYLSLIHI